MLIDEIIQNIKGVMNCKNSIDIKFGKHKISTFAV